MTARALLHRAIVAISGMPDSMATPMNSMPGRLDVDTREAWKLWGRPGSGCTGAGCNQGRAPEHCDCHDTELSREIGIDPDYVIAPPPPLDDSTRSRLRRRALVLVAVGFATLGALLGISDPRFTP